MQRFEELYDVSRHNELAVAIEFVKNLQTALNSRMVLSLNVDGGFNRTILQELIQEIDRLISQMSAVYQPLKAYADTTATTNKPFDVNIIA